MGFFSDLGKALLGTSVQQTPQTLHDQPMTMSASQSSGITDAHGRKIIPHISLRDLRSHRNGSHLIVTAWIMNESDQRLRIDDTFLLKQKRSPHQELAPNHSHELRLYDGPVLDNENEHQAWITYRLLVNGDVFMENFNIHYAIEHDGKRVIGGLTGDGPIRDI